MSDNALHLSVAYDHVHGFSGLPNLQMFLKFLQRTYLLEQDILPVVVNQVVFA